MYCAGLKGDCAAINIDSSSLPNKEGARFWSVPGSFFHRGASEESSRKVQNASTYIALQKSSREIAQGENQSAIGQFREVSSVGGASEESVRKVPKASTYRLLMSSKEMESRENRSAIGQFQEVSSVGGRRKKVPGMFKMQAHT